MCSYSSSCTRKYGSARQKNEYYFTMSVPEFFHKVSGKLTWLQQLSSVHLNQTCTAFIKQKRYPSWQSVEGYWLTFVQGRLMQAISHPTIVVRTFGMEGKQCQCTWRESISFFILDASLLLMLRAWIKIRSMFVFFVCPIWVYKWQRKCLYHALWI